jgi:decaprenylphospho-beta-D-ribofuranose 2-oxidase
MLSEDLERATKTAVLCRGLGRSYGDSALTPPSEPVVLNTTLADRLLAFDSASGVLRAEAGASIESLNQRLLPTSTSRMCPVSPIPPTVAQLFGDPA